MKKEKIIFWTATGIFVLFEGLLPALTSHTELAKEGISHLGYPDYFRVMLAVGKTLGGIVLILPVVPARFKEWAYAGFGITIIAACISHWVVDGFGSQTLFPILVFGVLALSYTYYHRLHLHSSAA